MERNELLSLLAAGTATPELAREAEAQGMATTAVRAWQIVLKDQPDHPEALRSLAALHDELGDDRRAEACRKRLNVAGAVSPQEPEPEPEPALEASEADLVRFQYLFAGREDVHARMWKENLRIGYSPVQQPLSPALIRQHLRGGVTLGVYVVRVDDTAGFFALDIDLNKDAIARASGDAARTHILLKTAHAYALAAMACMQALGLDPLLEDSGYKGRHLWCFLPEPLPAPTLHRFGQSLLAVLPPLPPDLHLEFFPKQAHVKEGGLGNLIKLPLGIHLRTGRRAALLDAAGVALSAPHVRLRSIRRPPLPELAPTPARPAQPVPPAQQAPPVVPAAEEPDWTEADFEASTEVGPIFRGCPVIQAIVTRALRDRRIGREESVVLNHSLGHLPDGVRGANYVYGQIPHFPADQKMGAPLRGSPISCARIRQRVPGIAGSVPCTCAFEPGPGAYPNPLLHRDPAPAPIVDGRTLDELLDAYVRIQDRQKQLMEEEGALRRSIVRRMEQIPDRRWRHGEGEWAVREEEGLPVLTWEKP